MAKRGGEQCGGEAIPHQGMISSSLLGQGGTCGCISNFVDGKERLGGWAGNE
jgi:hypothetical protein